VSYGYDQDGSLVFKCRLPAEVGALLLQALDAAMQRIPNREISADLVQEFSMTYRERRADALGVLAPALPRKRSTNGEQRQP
jgi:hypothetical protein